MQLDSRKKIDLNPSVETIALIYLLEFSDEIVISNCNNYEMRTAMNRLYSWFEFYRLGKKLITICNTLTVTARDGRLTDIQRNTVI